MVTVTNDTMLVPVATVGKPWFDKLPADLQKAVEGSRPGGAEEDRRLHRASSWPACRSAGRRSAARCS